MSDIKPDLNLDDWDNLPLDASADDWDAPAAAAPFTPPSPPDEPPPVAETAPPDFPETSAPVEEPDFSTGDTDDVPEVSADDADDNVPDEDIEADLAAEALAGLGPDLSDIDLHEESPAADTFDPPVSLDSSEAAWEPDAPAIGPDRDPDEADETGEEAAPEPPSSMPDVSVNLDELSTKKVELDIDGIFLESAESEAPPEEEPEPETAPPAAEEPVAAAPSPAPSRKKIPRAKLLLIAVPGVLLVLGLLFGVYTLFFAEDEPPPVREAVIDPQLPPREPEPGDLPAESFYVGFPGPQGDTLVEIMVILHYNDVPDQRLITENLPEVRDIIYRAVQGKGSAVIADGEMQRALREELALSLNQALGRAAVSYVQFPQIRILH